MGLGVGIFLIAVGAILTFAVNATSGAVNIHTVGWILMAVGLLGILLSMLFWQSWAGPGYWSRRRTTYVDDGPPAAGPPY
jgi:Na+/proline symporter